MRHRLFACLLTLCFARLQAQDRTIQQSTNGTSPVLSDRISPRNMTEQYDALPLGFEANQGQTDARVKFISRGDGYTLFLTPDESVFSLRGSDSPAKLRLTDPSRRVLGTSHESVLGIRLLNANHEVTILGTSNLSMKTNYFIGNDSNRWRSNVPTYAKVRYEGIYPGIDLVCYGLQRQLEYDFVVRPGADYRHIQFKVRGVSAIERNKLGDLLLDSSSGVVVLHKPVIYQETNDGRRQYVEGRYHIFRKHRIDFAIGKYNPTIPLVIDPAIGYSTYLGGSGFDSGASISVDSHGNTYLIGYTQSLDFPTTPNAFQTTCGGQCNNSTYDAFITKFDSTGSSLIYSTYLGGSGTDVATGLAIDNSGNVFVAGTTYSKDFPITAGVFQPTCSGGCSTFPDAFVTKLDPTGSVLVYSTFLGGTNYDGVANLAVDALGNAYLNGVTWSADFPVTPGALQTKCGGGCSNSSDAFVTKLNSTGSALVYSTFLGGAGSDAGGGIALDDLGDAYLTGVTQSANFPVTPNAIQPTCSGGCISRDAFVTEINPTGSALLYSTFLGGSDIETGTAIALDSLGNIYVSGNTASTDFPTTSGAFQTSNAGSYDAFVTKLNASGSSFVYSTYIGGSSSEGLGFGIGVDAAGDVYIAGQTSSSDFPTTPGAFQTTCAICTGLVFMTELNASGSALVYSSYFGGTGNNVESSIALDSASNVYVTGYTQSIDFPVTPDAVQAQCAGGCKSGDAFLAKFVQGDQVWPLSLNFGNQIVGTSSSSRNTTFTNSETNAISIASITITGVNGADFVQKNTCGGTLAAGASCTISVTFTPTAPLTRTATLTITDSAANSPQTVSLTGTGIGSAVTLNPASLNFGNQTVGIASNQQVSTLTNTGNTTLSISSIILTGNNAAEFSASNNCPSSLGVGVSCSISVSFTPANTGSRTASVTITDNGAGSPQSLPLSGVGVLPAVTLSSTSLTFPDQTIFTASKDQVVTLTNSGLGILNITSISASVPFFQNNTCGATVNPGANCTISVTFIPRAKGIVTGSVSITDNASGSLQTVSLKGTGTYVQLTPASLNFGTQPVGTTSLAKKIILTNKGSVAVSMTSISITGLDASDFAQTNTCGTSVAAGGSCFIKVTFTPSAKGKRTASVSITDNGGGSPQKVSLTGTGT
jgi:hypothetical protein